MAEQADADELMRQYLDLWQDQMSALAADQDFARAMQQVMAGMGLAGTATPAAWAGLMTGLVPATQGPVTQGDATADGQGREAAPSERSGTPSGRANAPGAAPSRAASGGGGADVGKLTRRIAALEKRIAALEGGPAPKRRRAASKPRKARS